MFDILLEKVVRDPDVPKLIRDPFFLYALDSTHAIAPDTYAAWILCKTRRLTGSIPLQVSYQVILEASVDRQLLRTDWTIYQIGLPLWSVLHTPVPTMPMRSDCFCGNQSTILCLMASCAILNQHCSVLADYCQCLCSVQVLVAPTSSRCEIANEHRPFHRSAQSPGPQ